jgi:hypothetical protein
MNIFQMLAHVETAFDPVLVLGRAILSKLAFDPKLPELSLLRAGNDSSV